MEETVGVSDAIRKFEAARGGASLFAGLPSG